VAAGTAGVFLGGDGAKSTAQPEEKPDDPRIRRYVKLGDTGITISDVIFGAGALYEPDMVRHAYDRGVTGFDTDALYTSGRSEESIGSALKGVRDKCCIITKQSFSRRNPADRKTITQTLERSLRRLQTDYVDGLFVHSMEEMNALHDDVVIESFMRFKKEGKIRFTGFSTHNERVTLAECVKARYDGIADVVMFRYNHMEGKSIEPLIAAVNKKGIGTIAMKTLAGGKQGKLKEFVWVLANERVDCAVMSMGNYSAVDSYVGASGMEFDRSGHSLLRKYRDAVDGTYCRVTCTACEGACPLNVAISDIMRYEMYYLDYGHQKKAIRQYATLDAARKPAACATCAGQCTRACPHGLQVRDRLLRAHEILAI
jgi:predicted aldo/keto reductase-like oxidoreductase